MIVGTNNLSMGCFTLTIHTNSGTAICGSQEHMLLCQQDMLDARPPRQIAGFASEPPLLRLAHHT